MVGQDSTARREEVAAGLARVEQRIAAACRAAGRSRADVQLIAVTKNFPGSDVEVLCELGVTDIGENRDQEASAKIAARPRGSVSAFRSTSSVSCSPTRPPRWPPTSTPSTPSTGTSWSSPSTALPPLPAVTSARWFKWVWAQAWPGRAEVAYRLTALPSLRTALLLHDI